MWKTVVLECGGEGRVPVNLMVYRKPSLSKKRVYTQPLLPPNSLTNTLHYFNFPTVIYVVLS
jgi:hypothetical protein